MERCLLSEEFKAGGVSWRILLYPRGDPDENVSGYVSMYLESVDDPNLTVPDNWKKHASAQCCKGNFQRTTSVCLTQVHREQYFHFTTVRHL